MQSLDWLTNGSRNEKEAKQKARGEFKEGILS